MLVVNVGIVSSLSVSASDRPFQAAVLIRYKQPDHRKVILLIKVPEAVCCPFPLLYIHCAPKFHAILPSSSIETAFCPE